MTAPDAPEELVNNFTYHPPTPEKIALYQEIRARALTFGTFLGANVPDCVELVNSLTRLEETVMWANAGIARNP